MARQNQNEFRPDQVGKSLLSRLYLTKLQRQSIKKWLFYALVLLVVSVIQDVIMSRLRLFGVTTDLMPCAIFCLCILLGTEDGSVFALVASLMYLFSGTSPGNFAVPLIVFLAVLMNIFRQSYLRKGFSATALCTTGCMVLYELLIFCIGAIFGWTPWSRIVGYLLTAGYSLVAIPILYPLYLAIGKIGGQTWKE
jgi:hypothetical protein